MDDLIKDMQKKGLISIDRFVLYLAQTDTQGNYIQLPEHPASKECLKLQRFINYSIELN